MTARQRMALASPLLILVTMLVVFGTLGRFLRPEHAWAVGYAVYWVVWGIAYPLALLGWRPVVTLFVRGRRPSIGQSIALAVPPIAVFVISGWPALDRLGWSALGLGLGFMIVNGLATELLWRGTFVRLFPARPALSVVYPALAFAAWHLVPATSGWIHPRLALLVAGAALVGLLYGYVTLRTRTVRWVALSHGLTDLAGVGMAVALAT